jgi:hypothetical protein
MTQFWNPSGSLTPPLFGQMKKCLQRGRVCPCICLNHLIRVVSLRPLITQEAREVRRIQSPCRQTPG